MPSSLNHLLKVSFPVWMWKALRLLAILMVSVYIVLAGQTTAIALLVARPSFYIAVTFSFLLSLALIELSEYFNRQLNHSFPWRENLISRIVLQICLCFALMLILTYSAIRVYFWALDGDFHGSGYMKVEFLIVTWMFLALNLQLLVQQMWPVYFQATKRAEKRYAPIINGYTTRARIALEVDQIACLQREGNLGFCWLRDGRKFSIDYKMEELRKILDPKLFVQISRAEIFPLSIIEGYDKKVPCVILKMALDREVSCKISEGRLATFINAFQDFSDGIASN